MVKGKGQTVFTVAEEKKNEKTGAAGGGVTEKKVKQSPFSATQVAQQTTQHPAA